MPCLRLRRGKESRVHPNPLARLRCVPLSLDPTRNVDGLIGYANKSKCIHHPSSTIHHSSPITQPTHPLTPKPKPPNPQKHQHTTHHSPLTPHPPHQHQPPPSILPPHPSPVSSFSSSSFQPPASSFLIGESAHQLWPSIHPSTIHPSHSVRRKIV